MEPITLSGIALPVLVGLTVAALRKVKLIKTGDQARRAAFVTAFAWAAPWIAVQFYPAAAPAVATVITALVSALLAAAAYEVQEAARGKLNGK